STRYIRGEINVEGDYTPFTLIVSKHFMRVLWRGAVPEDKDMKHYEDKIKSRFKELKLMVDDINLSPEELKVISAIFSYISNLPTKEEGKEQYTDLNQDEFEEIYYNILNKINERETKDRNPN